jgi:hypothetical protein
MHVAAARECVMGASGLAPALVVSTAFMARPWVYRQGAATILQLAHCSQGRGSKCRLRAWCSNEGGVQPSCLD